MHHLAVESCLFQRALVVREFHMGYTCTLAGLWIGQRPNGTGSGGAYILLIMHCWHYLRRSWFTFTTVLVSGGEGDYGC